MPTLETIYTESFSRHIFDNLILEAGEIRILTEHSEIRGGEEAQTSFWEGADEVTRTVYSASEEYPVKAVAVSCFDSRGIDIKKYLQNCTRINIAFVDFEIIGRKRYGDHYIFEVSPETFKFKTDQEFLFNKIGWTFSNSEISEIKLNGPGEICNVVTFPENTVAGDVHEDTNAFPLDRNVMESSRNRHTVYINTEVPAELPNSFYSQIQNISGRYIGSKNGWKREYTGHKKKYTNETTQSFLKLSTQRTGSTGIPFYSTQEFEGSIVEDKNTNNVESKTFRYGSGVFLDTTGSFINPRFYRMRTEPLTKRKVYFNTMTVEGDILEIGGRLRDNLIFSGSLEKTYTVLPDPSHSIVLVGTLTGGTRYRGSISGSLLLSGSGRYLCEENITGTISNVVAATGSTGFEAFIDLTATNLTLRTAEPPGLILPVKGTLRGTVSLEVLEPGGYYGNMTEKFINLPGTGDVIYQQVGQHNQVRVSSATIYSIDQDAYLTTNREGIVIDVQNIPKE